MNLGLLGSEDEFEHMLNKSMELMERFGFTEVNVSYNVGSIQRTASISQTTENKTICISVIQARG